MLHVGLTGGIGSGKSAASALLRSAGALVVDSDALAREVVAPGTPGLQDIRTAFGSGVLDAEGALDRPALAAVVFADPEALSTLNSIIHPRVRAASEALIADAPADAVAVHDIPLLTENGLAPGFALVLVVQTDREVRLERLTTVRGMVRSDAEARMSAQASDDQRLAIADVVLDNTGPPEALAVQIDRLWQRRLLPFAANLAAGRPAVHRGAGKNDVDHLRRTSARLGHVLSMIKDVSLSSTDIGVEIDLTRQYAEPALGSLGAIGWLPRTDAADGTHLASADPDDPATVVIRWRE